VRAGDAALADFVGKLFPSDIAVASVGADQASKASRGFSKKKKKRASSGGGAPPKGFGSPATKAAALWCPALGLASRADVVLVVGREDRAAREAVDAASAALGDDVAIVLLNSRRRGLSGFPSSLDDDDDDAVDDDDADHGFVAAFALSPPPKLGKEEASSHQAWEKLLAYRVFPHPWAIATPKTGFLASGAEDLWEGDGPPSEVDTRTALDQLSSTAKRRR